MTELLSLLEEYVSARRALGASLEGAERLLRSFLAFLAQRGEDTISPRLALEWAVQPRHARPDWHASRLRTVRLFSVYAHAVDPSHEVPPAGLLTARPRRAKPYLYSDREVADLVSAAQDLPARTALRAATYATLLSLLAVTGMRPSEPLGLDQEDVDLADGVLTVRNAKFGKSRHLPVHESTCRALAAYAGRRDELCPSPAAPAFFLSDRGTRIPLNTLQRTFVLLSKRVGLRGPSDSHGPRLHDLRHRFAVNALLRWHREGRDVEAWLPHPTTYLGHVHLGDTYWYLTARPDLLQQVARRMDRDARSQVPS